MSTENGVIKPLNNIMVHAQCTQHQKKNIINSRTDLCCGDCLNIYTESSRQKVMFRLS